MKNYLLSLGFLLFCITSVFSQEQLAVIQNPYVVLLNAETGEIENPQFIDLTPLDPGTPKGIRQIGSEIWITDQIDDMIYRFDLEGNYLSSITGNLDNIKGLGPVNGSEVWVTNAGSNNGAPGDAIVRFDMNGNYLGNFLTAGNSSFDLIDGGNGEVYISYINGGSPIERRDYSGNLIGNLVAPGNLNFAQQIWITASGDLLVGNFSSPSGVYLFDLETGEELNFWPLSDVRGVSEAEDGSILWTNSSGINRLNPATGTSTLLSGGSAQFFTLLNPDETSCTTPTLSVEEPDAVCSGNSAFLTAVSNGEDVNWYDSETATTPIFTGTEFETPELTESTSYWVQAVSYGTGEGETIEGGARLMPASNSSSSVNPATNPWGLSFDATEDFTITSVDVYLASASPGDLVMQLLDEDWNVLDETTVSCPAGNSSNPVQFEVPLSFSVEGGNTYRLVAAASPTLVREFSSEHPGFPYPIGDLGSVTGGTINNANTNNTVYYFFYNWTVQTGDISVCQSDLIEVTVTVNPTPEAPNGESEQFFILGETLTDLEITATGDLTWYEDENGTIVLPENTPLVDGTTYYVSQTIDGCESELFAVTVYLFLGVDDVNVNLFSVYPNPVKDILNISGKSRIDSVEIFDLAGRKLSHISQLQDNQIDFRLFEKGTYLVRIVSGKNVRVVKIIK